MFANGLEEAISVDVVIDTSVWVSRVIEGDSNHQAAQNWINNHFRNGGTFIAPALFVIEVGAAISRQTGQPTFARTVVTQLRSLSRLQLATIDEQLIENATELAVGLGLRGADALYVALAIRLNVPLVSFDNEQLLKPAALLQTIRP